jgi:hypothetical protein
MPFTLANWPFNRKLLAAVTLSSPALNMNTRFASNIENINKITRKITVKNCTRLFGKILSTSSRDGKKDQYDGTIKGKMPDNLAEWTSAM